MISVEEAQSRILSYCSPLDGEVRPLLDALGQVLDEVVRSPFDIPPLANTAMDGYAVQASSTLAASRESPVELSVEGEVAAGYLYDGIVGPGAAVRIMTGAPIPAGADAVVPFEETDESGQQAPHATGPRDAKVRVFVAARPGANIRPAGEDVKGGQRVFEPGTVLHPAQLGVLASLGRADVRVIRRPIVAVLSTGDELVAPGEVRAPGRIYDSNATSIAALVREAGGIPKMLGVARDSVEDLTERIRQGLDADLVVTTAGVSRGDFDVVKLVLAREGAIDFWTVNMRPGKPLAFGTLGAGNRRVPHIGLPGNPVSAMVAFEVFGRPAIAKMLGLRHRRPVVQGITLDPIPMVDKRRFYARCTVREANGRYEARLAGSQSSGALSVLAHANALAIIPEDSDDVQPGAVITMMLLHDDLLA